MLDTWKSAMSAGRLKPLPPEVYCHSVVCPAPHWLESTPLRSAQARWFSRQFRLGSLRLA